MVSNADEKRLRHNPRHKTDAQEFDQAVSINPYVDPANQPGPELLAHLRLAGKLLSWELSLLGDDLQAKAILQRLDKICLRLSAAERMYLLETAENIAATEEAKRRRNLTMNRNRYVALNKCAIAAAKLAVELNTIFPHPWKEERAAVGDLVSGLVALLDGALLATMGAGTEQYLADRSAREMVRSLRKKLRKKLGRTHWELIRDLVWLASRKRIDLDESTIRRYLKDPPQVPNTPAHRRWNRHWSLLVECDRLMPSRKSRPFEIAALSYLNAVDSVKSREKSAPKRA